MSEPLDVSYYERLQDEGEELVLLIARHLARGDLPVEEALAAWGQCACRKHWDALLLTTSDLLPAYRTEEEFEAHDRVVFGQQFHVLLPAETLA